MKTLTTGLNPNNYKLPQNPLYTSFMSIFMEVWKEPVIDEAAHKATYVINKAGSDTNIAELLVGDNLLQEPTLGAYECDIISYLVSGEISPLILVGDVGCGKTSLLKNTRFLIEKSQTLRKKFCVCHLNFNPKKAQLEREIGKNDENAARKIVMKYIVDTATKEFNPLLIGRDDEFWQYAWEHADGLSRFKKLRDFYSSKFGPNSKECLEYSVERQQELVDSDGYFYALTSYFYNKQNIQLIVLMDNMDPLPRVVCESLLWIAEDLAHNSRSKIVMTMRDNTRRSLQKRIDALTFSQTEITSPDLVELITKRSKRFMHRVNQELLAEGKQNQLRASGLAPSDAVVLLESMVNVVLSRSSTDEIDRLTAGNRRLALAMLPVYFSSSYLHTPQLVEKINRIVKKPIEDVHLPSHVFVQSIVTNNYRTYFGRSPFPTICNVWTDQSGASLLSCFLPMMVLNRLAAVGGERTVEETVEEALYVFQENETLRRHIETHMRSVMLRLINSMLLVTPEFLIEERLDRLSPDSVISISPVGKYYVDEFGYRLEYFCYVKDAIAYNETKIDVLPCIDRPGLSERFMESNRMIRHMLAQELLLHENLKTDRKTWTRFVGILARHRGGGPELFVRPFADTFGQVALEQRLMMPVQAVSFFEDTRKTIGQAQESFASDCANI